MIINIKSAILKIVSQQPNLWDVQLADQLSQLYSRTNNTYWLGTIRVYLAELNASNLITITNEYWHKEKEKLLFSYRVTPFGLKRMRETGLT
jgi:hypothetical protein